MVEYGGGISHGPAGQVSGGGGAGGGAGPIVGGGQTDLFAPVGHFIDSAVHTVASMSPTELVVLGIAAFLAILILRRAL